MPTPPSTVTVTPLPANTVTIVDTDEVVNVITNTITVTASPTTSTQVLEVGAVGPQGAQGPVGPPGDGGDLSYTHTQTVSSSVWTITHNLGKMPSISVVDTGDNIVFGDVNYVNSNEAQILFASAFTGKAYLN